MAGVWKLTAGNIRENIHWNKKKERITNLSMNLIYVTGKRERGFVPQQQLSEHQHRPLSTKKAVLYLVFTVHLNNYGNMV